MRISRRGSILQLHSDSLLKQCGCNTIGCFSGVFLFRLTTYSRVIIYGVVSQWLNSFEVDRVPHGRVLERSYMRLLSFSCDMYATVFAILLLAYENADFPIALPPTTVCECPLSLVISGRVMNASLTSSAASCLNCVHGIRCWAYSRRGWMGVLFNIMHF